MFTTQEERDNAQRSYVTDLPITEISDFPNHPWTATEKTIPSW